MDDKRYYELFKKYEAYSDGELAREFVVVDTIVNVLWSDVDNFTSDLRELLSNVILERFIKKYDGSIWDETLSKYGNWKIAK